MKINKIVALLLMLAFYSCGKFLNDPPPESTLIETSRYSQSEDDTELSKIFEKDITEDLNKLQDKLHKFRKTVRPDRIGYLSKRNLEDTIDKLKLSKPDETKRGLDVLFAADALLFGGDGRFVSVKNIDTIFDFLRSLNSRYITELKTAFDIKEATLNEHKKYREIIRRVAKELVDELLEKSNLAEHLKSGHSACYDIMRDIVDKVLYDEKKKIGKKHTVKDTVETFLFGKKLLLDGDKLRITSEELYRFLLILPEAAVNAYDIIKANDLNYANKHDDDQKTRNEYMKFDLMASAVSNFGKLIYRKNGENREVFTSEDVGKVTAFLNKENSAIFDLENNIDEISEINRAFFNGDGSNSFTLKSLDKLLYYADEILRRFAYFYYLYSYKSGDIDYQAYMELPTQIVSNADISKDDKILQQMKQHPVLSEREKAYRDEFIYIVSRYKYFASEKVEILKTETDENGVAKRVPQTVSIPKYTDIYQRSKNGVAFVGVFQYLVLEVFKVYGLSARDLYHYHLSRCEIRKEECRKSDSRSKTCKQLLKNKIDECKDMVEFSRFKDSFGHGYVMTPVQMEIVLERFKKFLHEEHMINPKVGGIKSQSKSMRLVCDLFQHQSNGDGVINVNEFVESLINGFAGSSIGTYISDEFRERCAHDLRADGSPSEKCTRESFFKIMTQFESAVPGLVRFIHMGQLAQNDAEYKRCGFFERMKTFAIDPCDVENDCDYPYMSVRDFIYLISSFFNVEGILYRFDVGGGPRGIMNSILDNNELRVAFDQVFEREVGSYIKDAFSAFNESWDGLAFAGMLYLVKYGQMPSPVTKIVPYLLFENKKKITADRMNISNVLAFLSVENYSPDELDKSCK